MDAYSRGMLTDQQPMPTDQWRANPSQPDNWRGNRLKGPGWMGAFLTPDNKVMTENSIGVNMNGRQTEIPSIVPGMPPEDVTAVINGGMPESAVRRAADFAKQQMNRGQSPFANANSIPPSAYAQAMEQMRRQGPAWAQTENAMDLAQVQRALRRP